MRRKLPWWGWVLIAGAVAWLSSLLPLAWDVLAAEVNRQRLGILADVATPLVAIVGLYLLLRRARASDRQAEASRLTAETAQRQVLAFEQGQLTERFTRAIDQLGAVDNPQIRLGGIYALEQIARDSSTYHWPVVEVLAALVRQVAPQRSPDAPPYPEEEEEQRWAKLRADGRWPPYEFPPPGGPLLTKPDVAVQAALRAIGSRARDRDPEAAKIDLRRTCLAGADLSGLDLRGIDLSYSDLYRVDLSGADLTAAPLNEVNLTYAILHKASLRGADLTWARLDDANLTEADLRGSRLGACVLDRATLARADLRGAEIVNPNGEWATFADANLEQCDLRGVGVSREGHHQITRYQLSSAITDTRRESET